MRCSAEGSTSVAALSTSTQSGNVANKALKAIAWARNAQPSREKRSTASRKAEMNRRIRRGISCRVLVFPPAAPVTVAVDGRRIAAYVRAELAGGRVYAPLSLLRTLVDRLWIEGGAVFVESAGRRARVP